MGQRTAAWAPYPTDADGTPVGAVITACENGHIALTAAFTLNRPADQKPQCWAPACRTPLRAVSRQTADRIHAQARLARELRTAS
jgi:hypothetical protein